MPESGFNIYSEGDTEPFIGVINGPEAAAGSPIELECVNNRGDVLSKEILHASFSPYETKFLYPSRGMALQEFLEGGPGTMRVRSGIKGVFPRFVAGNLHHGVPAATITHTYYDCSSACGDADYWAAPADDWHPASLAVPARLSERHFTNIYFYPIYSPTRLAIDLELYRRDGALAGATRAFRVLDTRGPGIQQISVGAICRVLGLDEGVDYAVRVIARPLAGERTPARLKLGLDIGVLHRPVGACNICTNLDPFNPSIEEKPSTYRWTPILADQPDSSVWIMNSSPAVDYRRTAEMRMTFYREADSRLLIRDLAIAPNGFHLLRVNEDREVREFLQGRIGWMTLTTTNPYVALYYFAEGPAGIVGGDHGF